MERKQIIKTIIELHNFFIIEYGKMMGKKNWDNLWDIQLLELKPDRYYLVESLQVTNDDYENKTFKPTTEVRYLLRSQEARKYGDKHDAFYKRYLSTVAIENEFLENPQAYKDDLLKTIEETKKKREELAK